MQRAAVQAFRTARRVPKTLVGTKLSSVSSYSLGARSASSSSKDNGPPAPASSMYIRNFSVAVLSGLVGYGAWYAVQNPQAASGSAQSLSLSNSNTGTSTRGLSTSSTLSNSPTAPSEVGIEAEAAETTRRALVVDNEEFYTGQIVGDGPLAKDTDDFGRKVLEMLTPEQATERLRRNEESYIIGRGRGVVRYDVVQIPSNDPIEDDHAEKIVEVPNTVAAADADPSSDWMFWGVFDGHRYIFAICNGVTAGS
jgi:pyruvate dehydrogenase phosphatase